MTRWYENGLQFDCTRCGNCCKSGGEYHFVYIADEEIEPLAQTLGLDVESFLEAHCTEDDGWTVLKSEGPACQFLAEDGSCSVYAARPVQCRTWPFWTENLEQARWKGPVKERCPGLDQGKRFDADTIDAIAKENDAWKDDA
tara:strand:+ start:6031 stop:6456 length:426 start_codon:yes stop_codon:yes gene_type:complete